MMKTLGNIIQILGILGFLFSIINYFLGWIDHNVIIVVSSAVFYFGGMMLGAKVTKIQ